MRLRLRLRVAVAHLNCYLMPTTRRLRSIQLKYRLASHGYRQPVANRPGHLLVRAAPCSTIPMDAQAQTPFGPTVMDTVCEEGVF
jgi:hypothetical protein